MFISSFQNVEAGLECLNRRIMITRENVTSDRVPCYDVVIDQTQFIVSLRAQLRFNRASRANRALVLSLDLFPRFRSLLTYSSVTTTGQHYYITDMNIKFSLDKSFYINRALLNEISTYF